MKIAFVINFTHLFNFVKTQGSIPGVVKISLQSWDDLDFGLA